MKYSKTTLMELSHKYKSILKKCAFFNAAILLSVAIILPAGATTITEDLNLSGEEEEKHYNEDDVTIDANITLINSGIYTGDGNDLSISGKTFVMDNSEVGIHGNLNITGGDFTLRHDSEFAAPELSISGGNFTFDASHILSRTDEEEKGHIHISGGELLFNKGFIGAFNYSDGGETEDHISEGGEIDISGNAKITFNGGNGIDIAQDWEDDENDPAGGRFLANEILAENINLGGEAELKVASGATLKTTQATYTNGDSMDFDIPPSNIKLSENSKLSIDGALRANVINGSTVINNGTIKGNLTNTGTYTGLISGVTGEFVNNGTVNTWGNLEKGLLGTTNLIKASTLSKNLTFGSLNVQDSLDLGTNTLTADSFNVVDNATLAFRVSGKENFGKVVADNITISEKGTTLNLTLDTGVLAKDETKEFQVLDGTVEGSFANLSKNARYEFEDLGDGLFAITGKATSADVISDVGGDANDKAAASAWLDGDSFQAGSGAANVASHLNKLSQLAPQEFKKAVKALQPDSAPTGQTTATAINNQVAGAVSGRFGGPAPQGRSGGDSFKNAGLWAQGLANKSKLDKAQGFDGKTYGLAIGGDAEVADGLKVGLGYAYTNSDIDATGRSTDVDTHTAILYAEKAIGNAFVNGVATYGRSKYKEDKNVAGLKVKADYDMDAIYTQVMTGYNFYINNAMLTPEGGLRYLYTNTHSYTDSADQNVKSDKTNTLTGVLGGRASMAFQSGKATITPELKLAATYDIKNDKGGATVRLANGSSYAVNGDTLNRFGVETGAKIGMTVDNMEFSLNYEGKFKKDYTDHTGLVNFRYNF